MKAAASVTNEYDERGFARACMQALINYYNEYRGG